MEDPLKAALKLYETLFGPDPRSDQMGQVSRQITNKKHTLFSFPAKKKSI